MIARIRIPSHANNLISKIIPLNLKLKGYQYQFSGENALEFRKKYFYKGSLAWVHIGARFRFLHAGKIYISEKDSSHFLICETGIRIPLLFYGLLMSLLSTLVFLRLEIISFFILVNYPLILVSLYFYFKWRQLRFLKTIQNTSML